MATLQAPPPDLDIEQTLNMIDKKISDLKLEYEQYFIGLQKTPPGEKRDSITKALNKLGKERFKTTVQHFRYQQIKARFSTFSQHWDKILKQMENGTSKKDLFRSKLKTREEVDINKPKKAQKHEEDNQQNTTDSISSPVELKGLYQQYLHIRSKCKERTDNVKFEKMVDFLTQQTNQIKSKYSCRAVQFQVVVDNGKAKLKAVPIV